MSGIIIAAIIIIGAIILFGLFSRLRKYRGQARESTAALYRLKTEYKVRQKILELNKALFSENNSNQRKSPILIIAERFQMEFGLGRFVVFYSDRNSLAPMMGNGFKFRSIRSIKQESLADKTNEHSQAGKLTEYGFVIDSGTLKSLINEAGLPEAIENPFSYYYNLHGRSVLFIGEDSRGTIAEYSTMAEFNQAVWPLIYDICRNNNNLKKYHDKNKSLQDSLGSAQAELKTLTKKLRYQSIDLHSFYEISNSLFTIYDEKRLIESFSEAVKRVLRPAQIAILSADESRTVFKVITSGDNDSQVNSTLELALDSEIFKIMSAKKQPVLLPLVGSGLPEDNPFIDKVLSLGFSTMEKITVGAEIKALVLISDRQDNTAYNESELEIFSTLANMASLALNNIYQYSLIEKMSYTDYLTELYNYRYFYKRLKEEVYRAKRFDRMLALVIFDIDRFKVFNDTYGHQAGDEVLKNIAGLVTKSVRAIDIVSRYGGEEFCVIMPDTGFANCLIFIERLRKMIEGHKFTSNIVDDGYSISVSIGGAIYPVDAQTPERLIYCADMALLKAKNDGRNRSIMFNSLMLDDEDLVKSSQRQMTDLGIYEDL
jgi:diguanylate cyclase (GGDEF)-like protein